MILVYWLETRTRCTVADKISNKAQLSKVIKIDAQGAGIWLFWRDDGMKIDLVSSNFQASNCLRGGKRTGARRSIAYRKQEGLCEAAMRDRPQIFLVASGVLIYA